MTTLSKDDEQFLTGMMAGILLHNRWAGVTMGAGADVLLSRIVACRFELQAGEALPIWNKATKWATETDSLMNKR